MVRDSEVKAQKCGKICLHVVCLDLISLLLDILRVGFDFIDVETTIRIKLDTVFYVFSLFLIFSVVILMLIIARYAMTTSHLVHSCLTTR